MRRSLLAVLLLLLALAGVAPAPADAAPPARTAASVYPSPLPDFATGHGLLYTPRGGTTARKSLVIFVTLSGASPVPAHDPAWLARRWYGAGGVQDYFRTWSNGRLLLTPLRETSGTADDGVVVVDGGSAEEFLRRDPDLDAQAADIAASGRINTAALRLAAPLVDYASADRDGDHVVEQDELQVNVVWAPGTSDLGGRTRGHDKPLRLDGVDIDVNELTMTNTTTDLMTLVHEAGHALTRMRDLYGFGVSEYALAGPTGSEMWQGPSAFERMHLGWRYPTVVTRDGYYDVPRSVPATGGFLLYDPAQGTDDYLLVENRQIRRGSVDAVAVDSGLMVWRTVNSTYWQDNAVRRVQEPLRPTGERLPFPSCSGGSCYGGSASDAWDPSDPGTPQRTVSVPWAGQSSPSRVAVRAIGPSGPSMRVFFDVPGPGVLTDCFLGSGATRTVDAGRASSVGVTVRNTGLATDTFRFALSALPEGWLASGPATLTLGPGQQGVATFTLTAPPTGVRTATPTVTGTSTTDATVTSSCPLPLRASTAAGGPWAYLWANSPTAASYTPHTGYQSSSSGLPGTVQRTGVGSWTATLPGLAVTGGTVHVTAYDPAASCRTTGWGPSGTALSVGVRCTAPGGQALDARWSLSFAAPTTGGGLAHLWAGRPGTTSYTPDRLYSYNGAGGLNTVTRSGTGLYWVRLGGMGGTGGNVQVTPYGAGTSACNAVSWARDTANEQVRVACRDLAGAPADSAFTLTYTRGTALTGRAGAAFGHAWVSNKPGVPPVVDPASAASSSGGGATAFRDGPGDYGVLFPGLAGAGGTAHVTTYGSAAVRCAVTAWGRRPRRTRSSGCGAAARRGSRRTPRSASRTRVEASAGPAHPQVAQAGGARARPTTRASASSVRSIVAMTSYGPLVTAASVTEGRPATNRATSSARPGSACSSSSACGTAGVTGAACRRMLPGCCRRATRRWR